MFIRLLKGLLAAAYSKVGLVALLMVNSVLLARMLGAAEFGKYAYWTAAAVLLGMLFQFGLDQVALRRSAYLALQSSSRPVWALFIKVVSYSLVLSAPFLIIAALFLTSGGIEGVLIVVWASLLSFQAIAGESFRGLGLVGRAGLFGGILSNFTLAVAVLVVSASERSLTLYQAVQLTILCLLINAVAGAVVFKVKTGRTGNNEDKLREVTLVGALKEGAPYLLNSLAFFGLSRADVLILAAFRPATEVGAYAAASKLALMVALPLQIINAAIPSFIAEIRLGGRRERMQLLMRLLAAGATYPAVLLVSIVAVAGAEILEAVYGPEYRVAHFPLLILALGQVVNAWSGPAGRCLIMLDAGRYVLIAASAATVIGLATAAVLTPGLGAIGLASGIALSVAVHNVTMWFFCKRKLHIETSALGLLSVVAHARLLLERFASQNRLLSTAEKVIRSMEQVYWLAKGRQVVDVYGDSHSRIMRAVHLRFPDLPFRFRTIGVDGATAFGMANPNSKTNALNVFRYWASSTARAKVALYMMGEVDCGFLIWWRAKKTGADVGGLLRIALRNYQGFLSEQLKRYDHIVVCSAPLPTIPDKGAEGKIAKFRAEIGVDQLARTKLTLHFNKEMRAWCEMAGIIYIDMDKCSLDPDTGVVGQWLLNENRADHHYDAVAFTRILYPLLIEVAGTLKARAVR